MKEDALLHMLSAFALNRDHLKILIEHAEIVLCIMPHLKHDTSITNSV